MTTTIPTAPFSPRLTLQSFRDPFGVYDELARRHGRTFRWRGPLGPMVVTGDPAQVKMIFGAPVSTYAQIEFPDLAPFLGEHSVALQTGAPHQRSRRLVGPCLHADKAPADAIIAIVERHVARWPTGVPFKAFDAMRGVTIDILLSQIFGLDTTSHAANTLATLIQEWAAAFSIFLAFVPALRRDLGAWSPWGHYLRLRRELDREIMRLARNPSPGSVLEALVEARGDDGERVSDEELCHQVRTLFFAGHDTTATTITGGLEKSLRSPMIWLDSRFLATPGAADALALESLRCHPIAGDVVRRLREPLELAGEELPPGTMISIAPSLVHSHPGLYPVSGVFYPQRFLTPPWKPGPHELVAFGGGARRCLGAPLAMQGLRTVLPHLLKQHRFRSVGPLSKARRRGVTMAPDNGVPVIYIGPAR